MTSNAEAAEIFRTIADLLDLLGEKFKPEAYRRAARSIESLTEDLGVVSARHELQSIPGVGEAIAEKIEEYLRTGSVPYYERLKREIPPGLVELMRLPGLGPKTARRFWVELGVEGPGELRDAIAAGRLVGVKGFGEKKIDQIRSALATAVAGSGTVRRPIEDVYPVARALVEALRTGTGADRVEVAGSFRRARETVGDLDILVTSKDPRRAFEVFSKHPLIGEVKMRGETKETVVLQGGLQVDLRVVQPEEFGAALQYFTGSKDHNVRLRSLARERGLKVNEYGVFRGEERIAGASEEEVYASLGLAWIPPELREDRGEIEAAAKGNVPVLVTETDLRADWHVHLRPDARPEEVDRIVGEARTRRYAHVGIVIGGVGADGTRWVLPEESRARISALSFPGLRVARALETGPGAVPIELEATAFDFRIVRPDSSIPEVPGPRGSTFRPALIAHVGSSVASDAAALARWVEMARQSAAAIEVGPGPERLDSTAGRQARESGVPLHVPTGLGAKANDPTRFVALGFARRAGATPVAVANVRSVGEVSGAGSGPTRAPKGTSSVLPKSPSAKRRPA
jgi:DNA polymerase/3'-5' exonuclease PolX